MAETNDTDELAAIERLAKRLFDKMEHLEPSDQSDWDGLDDGDREFYRSCVKALLFEEEAILIALRYGARPTTTS